MDLFWTFLCSIFFSIHNTMNTIRITIFGVIGRGLEFMSPPCYYRLHRIQYRVAFTVLYPPLFNELINLDGERSQLDSNPQSGDKESELLFWGLSPLSHRWQVKQFFIDLLFLFMLVYGKLNVHSWDLELYSKKNLCKLLVYFFKFFKMIMYLPNSMFLFINGNKSRF
jgi:hypothetical protein